MTATFGNYKNVANSSSRTMTTNCTLNCMNSSNKTIKGQVQISMSGGNRIGNLMMTKKRLSLIFQIFHWHLISSSSYLTSMQLSWMMRRQTRLRNNLFLSRKWKQMLTKMKVHYSCKHRQFLKIKPTKFWTSCTQKSTRKISRTWCESMSWVSQTRRLQRKMLLNYKINRKIILIMPMNSNLID